MVGGRLTTAGGVSSASTKECTPVTRPCGAERELGSLPDENEVKLKSQLPAPFSLIRQIKVNSSLKYSKAKRPTETPTSAATRQHDIAIPMFGYKNHAGIDRAHGFIRGWTVTSASAQTEPSFAMSSPRTKRRRLSGLALPIARRPKRNGCRIMGSSPTSIKKSRRSNQCRRRCHEPIAAARRSARLSSMSSRGKKIR